MYICKICGKTFDVESTCGVNACLSCRRYGWSLSSLPSLKMIGLNGWLIIGVMGWPITGLIGWMTVRQQTQHVVFSLIGWRVIGLRGWPITVPIGLLFIVIISALYAMSLSLP